jgi:RNA recognition motif-containing protein
VYYSRSIIFGSLSYSFQPDAISNYSSTISVITCYNIYHTDPRFALGHISRHSASNGGFFFEADSGKSRNSCLDAREIEVVAHTKKEKKMDAKLYVGNLSYDTTEDGLRTKFSEAGTVVSVEVIKDRDTGRTKGFAFITMSNQEEAENAIKMYNGKTLDNREIKVNIARPREERPRRFNTRRRW